MSCCVGCSAAAAAACDWVVVMHLNLEGRATCHRLVGQQVLRRLFYQNMNQRQLLFLLLLALPSALQ